MIINESRRRLAVAKPFLINRNKWCFRNGEIKFRFEYYSITSGQAFAISRPSKRGFGKQNFFKRIRVNLFFESWIIGFLSRQVPLPVSTLLCKFCWFVIQGLQAKRGFSGSALPARREISFEWKILTHIACVDGAIYRRASLWGESVIRSLPEMTFDKWLMEFFTFSSLAIKRLRFAQR